MSTTTRAPLTGRRVVSLLLIALLTAAVWWVQDRDTSPSEDRSRDVPSAQSTSGDAGTDPDSGLSLVLAGELPAEARTTLELIDEGGPFSFERDGITFENREEILPDRPRGYYREYTVETPGSDDRGARRIVAGSSGEFYWTQDHYDSFERIAR